MANRNIVSTYNDFELEFRPGLGYRIWMPAKYSDVNIEIEGEYSDRNNPDPDNIVYSVHVATGNHFFLTPDQVERFAEQLTVAADVARHFNEFLNR